MRQRERINLVSQQQYKENVGTHRLCRRRRPYRSGVRETNDAPDVHAQSRLATTFGLGSDPVRTHGRGAFPFSYLSRRRSRRLLRARLPIWEEQSDDPCAIDMDHESGERPTIVLIDRGPEHCDIAQTILPLQRAGIQAVLVGDDVCLCGPDMLPPEAFRKECDAAATASSSRLAASGDLCDMVLPKLYSPGFKGIQIPTSLIDWVAAQRIKECIAGTPRSLCGPRAVVIGTFRWNIKTDPVLFELWSNSQSDWAFKKSFASIVTKLEQCVVFQPRYVITEAKDWGCGSRESTGFCSVACLRNTYCASGSMTVSGSVELEETLRQLCVYQQAQRCIINRTAVVAIRDLFCG